MSAAEEKKCFHSKGGIGGKPPQKTGGKEGLDLYTKEGGVAEIREKYPYDKTADQINRKGTKGEGMRKMVVHYTIEIGSKNGTDKGAATDCEDGLQAHHHIPFAFDFGYF